MSLSIPNFDRPSQIGEPTWEIATLFPAQGEWTESSFLALQSPHRFELVNGILELLPMPTWLHQLIVFWLTKRVDEFIAPRKLGLVAPAPLFVRLAPKSIRQPDIVFCFHDKISDRTKIQTSADLVMEVMSPGEDNRTRDLVDKRAAYAAAGIREYWIIDPEHRLITVLALEATEYRVAGEYPAGTQAKSLLLAGFEVDVTATFAAGEVPQ